MHKIKRIAVVTALMSGLLFLVWQMGQVGIATAETNCTGDNLIVTNTNSSGANSLRQAILDVCAGGTISFDSSLSGQTIDISPDGTLAISGTMTIDGSGLSDPITISGNQLGRVFFISSTGTLTLTHLVIADGALPTGGGACDFVCGGGIFVDFDGRLTLFNSSLTNNVASGGAALLNSGFVTIINSTFYSNTSMFEGSALRNGGEMTIVNSTFSGNTSLDEPGAAIYADIFSFLTMYHTTIANNRAPSVGGLAVHGTVHLGNNIIGNSQAPADCFVSNDPEFPGSIGINKNNLIEDGSCEAAFSGDPKLAPLADNGGATLTHALSPGSQAAGAGDSTICSHNLINYLDQRGVARPSDKPCDLGAFEVDEQRLSLPIIILP